MGGKRIHSKIYNGSYATRDGYDFRFSLYRIVHNRSCNEWKETVHLETLKGQRTLVLAMEQIWKFVMFSPNLNSGNSYNRARQVGV